MSDPVIKRYDKAAGGWDSLKRSYQALRDEGIVGAGARAMLRTNQDHGFDCPGCAWPDRNPNSTFEFCENGAKAVAAEATAKRITRDFFAQHTVTQLSGQDDFWLEAQGRLTEPMRYDATSDRYVPVLWDEAFALVAARLNALDSPDRAVFYTSGRMQRAMFDPFDPLARHRPLDDLAYALDHFFVKLYKVADSMQTKSGRAMALQRRHVLERYVEDLLQEL